MLPEWLRENDDYAPDNSGHSFILKTYKALARTMAGIGYEEGENSEASQITKGKRRLPALFKLILVVTLILAVALVRNIIFIMSVCAVLLLYLAFLKPKEILLVIKPAMAAGIIALLIVLPAVFINPAGMYNNIFLVIRVLISVGLLSIFNHTTQWNSITKALRKIHVPVIIIFILDMTLRFIMLLGNLVSQLLTAVMLRSVGRNNRKYQSVGGVMGITFIRGMEMNQEMFEAMQCRGFTGEYK